LNFLKMHNEIGELLQTTVKERWALALVTFLKIVTNSQRRR
jgi:hypothetical protein